jgi:hypothetical protein
MLRYFVLCACLLCSSGCAFLPTISRQPQYHNPFPQLSKVAIAPFLNFSSEPTLDGRQVALAYFNELQSVPGFEVVPLGRVEEAMRMFNLTLSDPAEARKLAQLLEVDAVVMGAVTDYTPYYPPRLALQVEWYSANPNFHPIPPGYGLPWGTPDEEQIPGPLIFEARMALAREQMKTQEPIYRPATVPENTAPAPVTLPPGQENAQAKGSTATLASAQLPVGTTVPGAMPGTPPSATPGLPPDWPDPRGFTPPPPMQARQIGIESKEPVLRHTKTYNGNDADVTEALSTYVYFRDDARFNGWKSYLQRSDDYIRFCCHMHVAEMLTARGGAGETRVVWRWPTVR